jgi:hypothetical protein
MCTFTAVNSTIPRSTLSEQKRSKTLSLTNVLYLAAQKTCEIGAVKKPTGNTLRDNVYVSRSQPTIPRLTLSGQKRTLHFDSLFSKN